MIGPACIRHRPHPFVRALVYTRPIRILSCTVLPYFVIRNENSQPTDGMEYPIRRISAPSFQPVSFHPLNAFCTQALQFSLASRAIRPFLTATHPNSEHSVNTIKYSNIRFSNRNLSCCVAMRKISEEYPFVAPGFSSIGGKIAGF